MIVKENACKSPEQAKAFPGGLNHLEVFATTRVAGIFNNSSLQVRLLPSRATQSDGVCVCGEYSMPYRLHACFRGG
jgi:hypothetical protein